MSRPLPFSFEEFKSLYSRVPRLCIDLLIQTSKGYLLTLRQKNGWNNCWHFPGGTIYLHEKLNDAILRIAQEELGVKVFVDCLLSPIEYFSEIKERGFGYSISLPYLCHLPEKFTIQLDDQVSDYGFFTTPPNNMVLEQKNFLNHLVLNEEIKLETEILKTARKLKSSGQNITPLFLQKKFLIDHPRAQKLYQQLCE